MPAVAYAEKAWIAGRTVLLGNANAIRDVRDVAAMADPE
jgi:hypothetical protein